MMGPDDGIVNRECLECEIEVIELECDLGDECPLRPGGATAQSPLTNGNGQSSGRDPHADDTLNTETSQCLLNTEHTPRSASDAKAHHEPRMDIFYMDQLPQLRMMRTASVIPKITMMKTFEVFKEDTRKEHTEQFDTRMQDFQAHAKKNRAGSHRHGHKQHHRPAVVPSARGSPAAPQR